MPKDSKKKKPNANAGSKTVYPRTYNASTSNFVHMLNVAIVQRSG
ncbi:hypothetical protein SCAR479_03050 [Seiridium cardinale]|uniref:Uncharacterized protein n=1 Tax=Seiridium cardinale TaxID=138064 RepID=A0ABR2Y1H3_9PEZI